MEKKINTLIWALIAAAAAVWAVLHPRIGTILTVIICLVAVYIIHSRTDKLYTPDDGRPPVKVDPRSTKTSVKFMILLPVVAFLGSWLNIFCPYHATYEYQRDIAGFKAEDSTYYDYTHFPDEIPEGARHVRWLSSPYLVTCELLMFYADEEYIDSVCDEFSAGASKYPAIIDPEDEPNEELRRQYELESIPSFTAKQYIPSGTLDGLEVLMLTSSGDTNHPHSSGIFYNRKEGYIGYFCN